MDPYVLCHRLKFPSDYSPPNISDNQAPGSSKRGLVKKLFGRLTSGKSVSGYVCHHCHKIFTCLTAIQNHVRKQCANRGPVLQCELCDKIYTGKEIKRYIFHRQRKHPHKCSVCSKSFVNNMRFTMHATNEHPEINFYFKCDLCRKGFKTRNKLLKHYEEHRNQEPMEVRNLKQYRCSYCKQICFGFKNLAAHYREHQTDLRTDREERKKLSDYDKVRLERKLERKQEKSEASKQGFKKVGTLSFGDKILYVCYLCNIYFNEACELQNHMDYHKDGSTVCAKCQLAMSTLDELKEHQKLIHFHKCKMCYLTFVKKSHRKNHKTSCRGLKNGIKF